MLGNCRRSDRGGYLYIHCRSIRIFAELVFIRDGLSDPALKSVGFQAVTRARIAIVVLFSFWLGFVVLIDESEYSYLWAGHVCDWPGVWDGKIVKGEIINKLRKSSVIYNCKTILKRWSLGV
jgi:hypothetical protein